MPELDLTLIQTQFQILFDKVSYRDWEFYVGRKDNSLFLQVSFAASDNYDTTIEKELHKGRKWLLSVHMTKSELVQTALKAVLTAEEHEIRERFKYKGEAVFGPHFDLEELVQICELKKYDVRI